MPTLPSHPAQGLTGGRYGYPALLVLLVAALYGQFLWNPIVFDDLYLFMVDSTGHQPVMDLQFDGAQFRSLPYVTLAWTQAWFGQTLIYFRLGNLVLHAAVVVALYVCVLELRRAVAAKGVQVVGAAWRSASAADQRIAAVAALVFALHPVAVYAAGYLIQRTILMATLFSLLAVSAYVRGVVTVKTGWLWAVVPLYYLAVFSKEHAIMLALVFPLLSFALDRENGVRRSAFTPSNSRAYPWALWLTVWAMALVVAAMRRHFVGTAYELDAASLATQSGLDQPFLSSVLTQTWLFFRYVGLWLLPNVAWMSVDIRVPFAATPWSPYGLAALAYLGWGGAGAWLVWRGGRTAFLGLALLFPWLLGWTELVTVRLQEPFVLYRSYLWAAGAVAFLAVLPTFELGRKHLLLVVVLALTLFGLSMERLQTFSHPYLLWDDAARLLQGREDVPGAYRIFYNRGSELLKAKQWDLATRDLEKTVQLQSDFAPGFGNLGVAYLESSHWPQAQAAFSQAIALTTQAGQRPNGRYYLGRARVYDHLNNPAQARQDYESACRISGAGCDKLQ